MILDTSRVISSTRLIPSFLYFGLLENAGLAQIEILKDVDFLATIGQSMPAEVEALAARTGIRPEDVAGKVHSVTYRASKPPAS